MKRSHIDKDRRKQQLKELKKLHHEAEVKKLREVGNPCRSSIIPSKKDKALDSKWQRKNKFRFLEGENN